MFQIKSDFFSQQFNVLLFVSKENQINTTPMTPTQTINRGSPQVQWEKTPQKIKDDNNRIPKAKENVSI